MNSRRSSSWSGCGYRTPCGETNWGGRRGVGENASITVLGGRSPGQSVHLLTFWADARVSGSVLSSESQRGGAEPPADLDRGRHAFVAITFNVTSRQCARPECKEWFPVRLNKHGDATQLYHSRSCASKHAAEKRGRSRRVPKRRTCAVCERKLHPEQDYFCSNHCLGVGRKRRRHPNPGRRTRKCPGCGVTPLAPGDKACSILCEIKAKERGRPRRQSATLKASTKTV